MKHKLESRLPGEISVTSDTQWHQHYSRKQRKTKEPLDDSEKIDLKFNIHKTKIMVSGPITSWQINGETVETMRYFIFLDSKITADGDCNHEIKTHFLFGRKVMPNLDSILKSREITLPANFCLVKAMVFPVVMYRCESLTIKKTEGQRIDAFELWFWRRLLKVPCTARRSSQCILKEISPEHSLERPLLKLKLQYFGHMMWKTDSLEKNSDVGKDWRREEKGQQRLRWLYAITSSMDMSLSKLQEWWWTVKPVMLQSMELQRVGHDWASELNWTKSLWLCGSQQSMENYYRWEYQITLPAFCKICIQVKKQHFEQT